LPSGVRWPYQAARAAVKAAVICVIPLVSASPI
jgi:hypothetical protein